MAVIISRRSSYCPNFATAPFEEVLGSKDPGEPWGNWGATPGSQAAC